MAYVCGFYVAIQGLAIHSVFNCRLLHLLVVLMRKWVSSPTMYERVIRARK